MGRWSTRTSLVVAVLAATAAVLGGGFDAAAQFGPEGGSGTTTTTAPLPPVFGDGSSSTTTTTAASNGGPPTTGSTAPDQSPGPGPAPGPAPGEPAGDGGDGGADAGSVVRVVPPEAQAFINSIPRTSPNNNDALVQGAALLEAAGVPRDEAVRAVFGRFPILGPTHWSDDWYFPRWTGTQFRFHEGLDMFADYGTPVAAPVDGVAAVATNPLGGLTVKVVEPNGTYWYLAHLSGIAPGLTDGQAVTTGQVVGYVGNSGNAVGTPPHVHFGVYPQGGRAAPPKPVVDSWVADGAARVAELLAQLGASAPPATPIGAALRAFGTEVGPPTATGPSRGELLWATAANPAGGALQLADAAAAAVVERLDWTRRAAEQRAFDLAWAQSADRALRILAPLTNPTLRRAVEALRAAT